jgi:release factor glutamine methyltransferase
MRGVYCPEDDSYFLSEIIEDKIPLMLKKNGYLKILEIGSGSGIQLQTALNLGVKKQNIFSCDINPKAVHYCSQQGFNCIESDLFGNIKGKFDLIIFNPPYLPKDSQEPKNSQIATTGGNNGGEIINKFLKQAVRHLSKEGKIILLTSSLTKGINWESWNRKIIGGKKLFFEELKVFELTR